MQSRFKKNLLQPSLFTLSISYLSSSSPFLILIRYNNNLVQYRHQSVGSDHRLGPWMLLFLRVRRMTFDFDKFALVNLWFVLALWQRCNSGVVSTEMCWRQPAEVQSQHRRLWLTPTAMLLASVSPYHECTENGTKRGTIQWVVVVFLVHFDGQLPITAEICWSTTHWAQTELSFKCGLNQTKRLLWGRILWSIFRYVQRSIGRKWHNCGNVLLAE